MILQGYFQLNALESRNLLLDGPNGSLSNDDQSLSNGGVNEDDDDASKESQATASSQSGTFMYTKLIEG